MDTLTKPDLVFDVGAHKGEDSDFYLNLGYRVVAVEANPCSPPRYENDSVRPSTAAACQWWTKRSGRPLVPSTSM